ncbi:hypothetical protein BD309DRAFT_973900 [Dichomitus squalens]|nr:hypothetical protein BD309DRAFT_973900 [Dichomitus squalens]
MTTEESQRVSSETPLQTTKITTSPESQPAASKSQPVSSEIPPQTSEVTAPAKEEWETPLVMGPELTALNDVLEELVKQDRQLVKRFQDAREKALYNTTVVKNKGEGKLNPRVYTAPEEVTHVRGPTVFLAGSIEQNTAVAWQNEFIRRLDGIDCTIFNPRRRKWNPNLTQSELDLIFTQQVEWELACQEKADVIAMFFDPWTKSPITLLELGIFSQAVGKDGQRKLIVYCPKPFWRQGNVQIVCKEYGIPRAKTFDHLVDSVKAKIVELQGPQGAQKEQQEQQEEQQQEGEQQEEEGEQQQQEGEQQQQEGEQQQE